MSNPQTDTKEEQRVNASRRAQASISAALTSLGIEYNTVGGPMHRFWNFVVEAPLREGPRGVSITFHCAEGMMGAIIALKTPEGGLPDETRLRIYELISHVSLLRFQARFETGDKVYLRADSLWQIPAVPNALLLCCQTVLAAWVAINTDMPGILEPVFADEVPELRFLPIVQIEREELDPKGEEPASP